MYRLQFSQLSFTICVVGVLAGSVLLIHRPPAQAQLNNGRVDVLIGFGKAPGVSERALVRAHGGQVKYSFSIVPAIAASVPEQQLFGLIKARGVRQVELDGTFHESTIIPGDEMELANSWGVDRIDADQVHGADITGIGVKVAILDSGIDYDHPDLDICYIDGWDFVNGDDDPWDDRGHGTHVAGIVAAKGDGIGVIGVAPGADIYALKVLDDQGVGSFSDIIAALEWCMLNNIDVTNNSYSAKRDPGDLVQQAFNNAAQKGILHIAAAGNHGNRRATRDTIEYPAAYNSVVAVGAVNDMDERASWSGTGSALELSAPGVSIYSTFPGGTYAVYSGTSMASPHVAGTAALMIASGIDRSQFRLTLHETAEELGAAELYGWGLVDAEEACEVEP